MNFSYFSALHFDFGFEIKLWMGWTIRYSWVLELIKPKFFEVIFFCNAKTSDLFRPFKTKLGSKYWLNLVIVYPRLYLCYLMDVREYPETGCCLSSPSKRGKNSSYLIARLILISLIKNLVQLVPLFVHWIEFNAMRVYHSLRL